MYTASQKDSSNPAVSMAAKRFLRDFRMLRDLERTQQIHMEECHNQILREVNRITPEFAMVRTRERSCQDPRTKSLDACPHHRHATRCDGVTALWVSICGSASSPSSSAHESLSSAT